MYQKLNRVEQILFDVGAMFLLLFYIFSVMIMPMATQCHRGIYTLVTYLLVFLLYRSNDEKSRIQTAHRGRHRTRGLHRRDVHAAHHGGQAGSSWRN